MKDNKIRLAISIWMILCFFVIEACGGESDQQNKTVSPATEKRRCKVTFVELGSVNCVPCKMMKKVMDGLERKYPQDLCIVFYDVWTKQGEPFADQYGIRSIPTQVFLDSAGKEFLRHEGYYPEEEIEKIMAEKKVIH